VSLRSYLIEDRARDADDDVQVCRGCVSAISRRRRAINADLGVDPTEINALEMRTKGASLAMATNWICVRGIPFPFELVHLLTKGRIMPWCKQHFQVSSIWDISSGLWYVSLGSVLTGERLTWIPVGRHLRRLHPNHVPILSRDRQSHA
jgi:hypothetical protein